MAEELTLAQECEKIIYQVKELREKKDITTEVLSQMTGIPQPNIVRMETLKNTPNLKTLVKIAKALGGSVQVLES